jgi:hypothetical protein
MKNRQLQQKFQDYIDGEPIQWELSRILYAQNGGFARRTGDNKRAIGFSQTNGGIIVDYIKLKQKEEETEAKIQDSINLKIRNEEEYRKLKYLIEHGYNTKKQRELSDPDHQDSMIK